MEQKKLKFNMFFNNEGDNLEEIIIDTLTNYLNDKKEAQVIE